MAAVLLILLLTGCSTPSHTGTSVSANELIVHYLDVGQGDSEILQCSNQTMLIDAGTNQNGTSDISGIPVKISNNSSGQLNPGDEVQLQSSVNDGNLDVTSKHSDSNETTMDGILTAIDIKKGTVTIKMTGSLVTVNVNNAQIQSSTDNHLTYQLSDLKRLVGQDIKLEGLSKKGNTLYADTVKIGAGH